MMVTHRETNISSNIRAIIEQLNLNPVERRRRLIDRSRDRPRPLSSPAKITIGVYGCRNGDIDVKTRIEGYRDQGLRKEGKIDKIEKIVKSEKINNNDKNDNVDKSIGIEKNEKIDTNVKIEKIDPSPRCEAKNNYEKKSGKSRVIISIDNNDKSRMEILEDDKNYKKSNIEILTKDKDEKSNKSDIVIYPLENNDELDFLEEKKKIKEPTIDIWKVNHDDKPAFTVTSEKSEKVRIEIFKAEKNEEKSFLIHNPTRKIENESLKNNKRSEKFEIPAFKDLQEQKLQREMIDKKNLEIFDKLKESDVFNNENLEKLKIEIIKPKNDEKFDREQVTPVTTPSGKVTIGVWGQTRSSELTIERSASFGRVIRKQEVDDENKCVVVSRSRKPEMRQRIPPQQKDIVDLSEVTRTPPDVVEGVVTASAAAKEDLPELETASLNHTAAHHRISVRPKNRRPPRRGVTASMSCSTITTISETSDTMDSLEPVISSAGSSPVEPKAPILRKSSSRLSRNSDIFEELEAKLPRKPQEPRASLSPDSLDSSARIIDTSETEEIKPVTRRPSNRISKGSDIFEELESRLPQRRSSNRLSKSPDSLDNSISRSTENIDQEDVKITRRMNSISTDKIAEEIKPAPRRLPTAISRSSEGFDKMILAEEPRPVARRLLLPISKSIDGVSKSSDSLEVLETLTSDDSIERRRSSFEIRPRRGLKVMSMSSENFEALEGLQKRNSASDVSLSRGKRHCKVISKSTESFEAIEDENRSMEEVNWRSKRMSSESSDNVEGEEKTERKARRSRRSSSVVEGEEDRRPVPMRKPSRLQKSSESSELGSTDTLDSERRNKSSDSTETLDSLEKDGESRDEEMSDEGVDKRDKHDSWIKTESETPTADGNEEPPKSPEKTYWRQTSDAKENIDIHQLYALTLVNNRMSDNGNNQRNNSVQFPKKKLSSSPPTSPVVKQEDNKILFNNIKNDEDLQNMLNGNISEVSTDTKSFKEKLIMFEKLGK